MFLLHRVTNGSSRVHGSFATHGMKRRCSTMRIGLEVFVDQSLQIVGFDMIVFALLLLVKHIQQTMARRRCAHRSLSWCRLQGQICTMNHRKNEQKKQNNRPEKRMRWICVQHCLHTEKESDDELRRRRRSEWAKEFRSVLEQIPLIFGFFLYMNRRTDF